MGGVFTDSSFRQETALMLELCREAGSLALDYFDSGIAVSTKQDGSPVTVADREVEAMIRERIQKSFPEDGILGEEDREKPSSGGERRWIVDPIDGTMNFARGIPLFSTLVAFEEDGDIVCGAIYNPVLADLYYAEAGRGAYKNGKKIKVSDVSELSSALLSFGSLERFVRAGYWENLEKLIKASYKQRGLGDYLGFALVFEGKAEANIEIGLAPWDLAPMKILVSEAGGCFCDLDGGDSIYQGSCIVSNQRLVEDLKSFF